MLVYKTGTVQECVGKDDRKTEKSERSDTEVETERKMFGSIGDRKTEEK